MQNKNNYNYIKCKKRFGQNFLKNKFYVDKIIKAINPERNQNIIEIGPGLAALTKPILEYLDYLTVIEIDKNLVFFLKNHPLIKSKLIIYQKDVMNVNFSKIAKEMGQKIRIFGNIPYNISTSLILHLLNFKNDIIDIHLMLQKDIVNRLIAKPNNKSYGRLSIIVQFHYEILPIIEVPPKAFKPSPKVDSTFIKLTPHNKLFNNVNSTNILSFITKEAFSQRRKTIRNSLKNIFNVSTIINLGIDPSMRAENISIDQYCLLANYIYKNTYSK